MLSALLLSAVMLGPPAVDVPTGPPAVDVACPNPSCPCPACECGAECDCGLSKGTAPQRQSGEPVLKAAAPLTIHVWDQKYCPHGDLAEREIIPRLAEEGWKAGKHYRIVRDDSGPCPQFTWQGKPFSSQGFTGWLAWRSELCDAMGVDAPAAGPSPGQPVAAGGSSSPPAAPAVSSHGIQLAAGERLVAVDGRPVPAPSSPMMQRTVVPRDPRPGHWTYPGDIRSHLRSHGIDPTGMTMEQMLTAHDLAHEVGWRPSRVMAQPSQRTYYAVRGNCPSGGCPR